MQYEAEIITFWTRAFRDEIGRMANIPAVTDLFDLRSWEDVTGQLSQEIPPSHNLLIVRCVVEKIELDKIRSHLQHHCLWCRPVAGTDPTAELPDDKIPQAEEDALHTFLAGRGTTDADRILAVGPRTAGRTRRDVARRMKSWMRTLTKAA